MVEFTQILCPFDFSETAARALLHADAWAARYDARLEVLHVVREGSDDLPWPSGRESDRTPQPTQPTSHEAIEAEIRRRLGPLPVGSRSPVVRIESGRPADVIVQRARTLAADLLVMGTHGRSGVNRWLLGSVTEKVLRAAPCPVLTVPGHDTDGPPSGVRLKRIVCALDFSPSAVKALAYALELGRQADGHVTVLYALEYMDPEEPCEHVDFDIRQRRQHFIDHARQRLHAQLAQEPVDWCEIEPVVAIDRAYKAVLRHAVETKADLIVMGAQGTGGLELMMYGSNTQHVLRTASCPVLTVRA